MTSDSKQLKILISGDVQGKLSDLYAKIDLIQSKAGKFDMLFCLGEFFGESNDELDEYISNKKTVPIMTYILGTNRISRKFYLRNEEGCDLCDKITYLGFKGMFNTKEGLKCVYLGGFDKSTIKSFENENDLITFDEKDIEKLEINCQIKDFTGIDLLLTNQWPKNIEKLAQPLENNQNSEKFGSDLISRLANNLKPRYHFSANQNFFYERSPYHNAKIYGQEIHTTRFIGVSKVNKKNKPKFLYAFNIVPMIKMNRRDLIQFSNEITDCPYGIIEKNAAKRGASQLDEPSLQYFYDSKQMEEMNKLNKKQRGDGKNAERTMEPCWFCLGGTKIEKQYIVSIGIKCYLAYAKGALNPDHLLILPINHIQSTISCSDEVLEDITAYKEALVKYFKTKNKCVVFFERNFKTQHLQIQAFAIPNDKAFFLKDAFMGASTQQNIELDEIPEFSDLKQILEPNKPYFYLELPNNEGRYLCEIKSREFPINFGRDIIAGEMILNLPDRIDWKKCVRAEDEEKEITKIFRTKFQDFEPSNK